MKRALIALAVTLVAGVALPSCNKDYDCVCRLNGAEVERYSVRESNKNAAEDECNSKQASLGVTYQCSIE